VAPLAAVAAVGGAVKLVLTVCARNEADVIDAQIAFHLHAGVDFVVATDNLSDDGTTEIFERYERAGFLHLIRESGDDMRQDEWVTRMARLAATEFGADWVINSDADEFWWPRAGSLKDVLAAVPERYGVVRGCWRHYLPRPEDGGEFFERMTVRLTQPAGPGDKRTIYHIHQKIAHRRDPDVAVEFGNHEAVGLGLDPLRAWHPLEVLHFSIRSERQLERKAEGGVMRNRRYQPVAHDVRLHEAGREGRIADLFRSFVVDDEALRRGLADGTLETDTRLRDALRSLRDGGEFLLPDPGSPRLAFPRPGVCDDAAYAGEASMLEEIDGIVRAEGRVDALERRLAALERRQLRRLATR
jgi:Glycosyl transferase family 2